ncbi:MAG: hypothetical protein JWR15_1401 [Prosthecobacter sp.]|nr:hypothetical protein [Prosthecobacter sp.]
MGNQDTSPATRKSQIIRCVVFFIGTAAALGWSCLSVWAGSQDNNQGEFFDPATGRWEWDVVAFYFTYPLVLWLLLFALFGGFRRQK